MPTSLLILGGTGFVGPALVDAGLARGWEVTTFNRGRRDAAPGVEQLTGDRLDPATLVPLADRDWDLVADTWSGAPRAARDSAALLAPRTGRYVYISSESVYQPPPPLGVRESDPTVDAAPDAESGAYAELKRGAELAVVDAFGDRALLARAGLILGPGEDVGRLVWWLQRLARGGDVLAPGPPELKLQYIDARDLAGFVLEAAMAGHSGPFNVVSRPGHATMASLLTACAEVTGSEATLRWIAPDALLEAGVEPWTELPVWIPPGHEYSGMHAADVERAHSAGLRCRPLHDTVADTWAWLSALGGPPPLRRDLPPLGLAPERERSLLSAQAFRSS
jgi:2'-hydroxyisoflavone reductase